MSEGDKSSGKKPYVPRRGDVVLGVAQGSFGKPRPMVVVQSDQINEYHPSVILCPLTSNLMDTPSMRITILPTLRNGLQTPSQIMTDKIVALEKRRIGGRIGRLEPHEMEHLDSALRLCLQL